MERKNKMFGELSKTLKSFGGHLECKICGNKKPLGSVGNKLTNGWDKCCGYTMTWITENELKNKSE